MQQEIVARGIEKSAILAIGTYIGGIDIPVGKYYLDEADGPYDDHTELVLLQNEKLKYKDGSSMSKIYELVNGNKGYHLYANIENGDKLQINLKSKLTICSGPVFK